MDKTLRHPERFDPREGEGSLIDTEHHARYWWASRAITGMDVLDAGCGVGYGVEILAAAGAATVTGVDIDPAAVEQARSRFGESAEAIVEGDLLDLPFDDESFDGVVCFEAIEHVEDGERALAELRRILRPDGVLLISSPNPDVYPPGNEHHIHEYRPAELAAAVGEHFAHVARYRQHAWLASTIEPAGAERAPDGNGAGVGDRSDLARIDRTATLDADAEAFGLLVAGNRTLPPDFSGIVSLGTDFEVGRQAGEIEREADRAVAQANRREAAALERQRNTAASLLEANQELARIPLLERRMAVVTEESAQLSQRLAELESSKSWRLTAPIRGLRARWRQ